MWHTDHVHVSWDGKVDGGLLAVRARELPVGIDGALARDTLPPSSICSCCWDAGCDGDDGRGAATEADMLDGEMSGVA